MSDDAPPNATPLDPSAVYDRVGGLEAFEQLVDAFYGRVEQDEVLRPQYPDDLEPGKRHLALFLAQYWGGGDLYSSERGHPRLRMRHAPFDVTPEAALRWATHMSAAIRELRFPSDVEALLLGYVARATPTLVNRLPDDVTELPSR
ncbi:globin domain-containing protein [Egicoccus halophilus]|uniref:Globin n=1 Tax=Egicoccus halophilus TaxID=1670830 RepID=A0A8J3EUN1_9ACTN|nr:globin [Egicoccus halophilus]GGI06244.1 globin [Egicoccus halophilus]